MILSSMTFPQKENHVQKITNEFRLNKADRGSNTTLNLIKELLQDSYITFDVVYTNFLIFSTSTYEINNYSTIKTFGIFELVFIV